MAVGSILRKLPSTNNRMIKITEPDVFYTGNCLCAAISYTVAGGLREVINCHCSQCRRFHGHFAAYTAAQRDEVTVHDQDKQLTWYCSSEKARRGFCARCGSSLFWDEYLSGWLRIAAGTLDQPTGLRTVAHIYTADQGDYYVLTDDVDKRPQGLRD